MGDSVGCEVELRRPLANAPWCGVVAGEVSGCVGRCRLERQLGIDPETIAELIPSRQNEWRRQWMPEQELSARHE